MIFQQRHLDAVLTAAVPISLDYLREDANVTKITLLPDQNSPLYMANADGRPLELPLNFDAFIGDMVLYKNSWDLAKIENVTTIIERLGVPQCTLVDVGANVGLFSRQLLRALAGRLTQVIGYEPHPTNFELLEHNLAGAPKCQLHNAGLSDTAGTLTLHVDVANSGNYSLFEGAVLPENKTLSGSVDVEVRDVAIEFSTLAENCDGSIIYKSDTQGLDQRIACAIPDEFWARTKLAVFELWRLPNNPYDVSAFSAVLDRFDNLRLQKAFDRPLTTAEVIEFLDADDRKHGDLYAW